MHVVVLFHKNPAGNMYQRAITAIDVDSFRTYNTYNTVVKLPNGHIYLPGDAY